jgi:hypothetical protein
MKAINKIKFCLIAISVIFLQSCSNDDTLIKKVEDGTTSGAILRTIKVNNGTFNFYDTSSKWSIDVEEQDGGKLFSELKVYATQVKNGANGTEKLVKTYSAASFTNGPRNLPINTISATLSEVLTSLGLTSGQYAPTDIFKMRVEVILSDGKKYSVNSVGSGINGVSYFNSPFTYTVPFFCPLASAADFNGDWKVTLDEFNDYPAGDIVHVVYNASYGQYTFRIMNTGRDQGGLDNPATSYLIVTIDPKDATVKVTSNEPWFYYGFKDKYIVTGEGSVASCTGDINLKLNFPPYLNQKFNLVKK